MATKEQLELREKWLVALESGDYKQCRNTLYNGEGYCCLGVACVVAGFQPKKNNDYHTTYSFADHMSVLPGSVVQLYGFRSQTGGDTDIGHLPTFNDERGFTFSQIAKYVREHDKDIWED